MRRAARRIRQSGIPWVAIAAIFSPLDPLCEDRAAEILREECPEAAFTRSRDLGRIGLLERENAALLNAALIPLARATQCRARDGNREVRSRGAPARRGGRCRPGQPRNGRYRRPA